MSDRAQSPAVQNLIVSHILRDLTDRRGLKQEWNSIDADVQHEIRTTWEAIVAGHLDQAAGVNPAKDRLTTLAEDVLRIIVNVNGGIPTPNNKADSVGREIVRQCRELYAEIETPTERPGRGKRSAVADASYGPADGDDDGDDDARMNAYYPEDDL